MKKAYFLLIILVLATGCSSLLAFSPGRAAVQAVLNNPVPSFQVDHDSVRVLQTAPVGKAVFALVSFSGLRSGSKELCDFVYVIERGGLGWRSSGGGGGCLPEAQPPGPIEVGSGWNGPGGPAPQAGYSHTAGLVSQVDVASVEVTWEDGETQTLDVINGSYLAGRTGKHNPAKVMARDAKGQEVFAWAPPELPAGKVEPTSVP